GRVVDLPGRMTLAAQLRGAAGREPPGLNDRRVGFPRQMKPVAPLRTAIEPRVLTARTVARFAGDAEFGRVRVRRLHVNRLRSERRIEPRSPVRCMARDA